MPVRPPTILATEDLPLSRTRRARRQRLLDVAERLFLHTGYHGTTMERIAATADVSKATLYKYFADKDALLLALVGAHRLMPTPALTQQTQAALEGILAAMVDSTRAIELEPALLQLLRVASEGRGDGFIRLMTELAFNRPDLLTRTRAAIVDRATERFYAPFEARLAEALPRGLDADVLMQIFYALITGYRIMDAATSGNPRLTPDRWAAGLAALLGSMRRPPI